MKCNLFFYLYFFNYYYYYFFLNVIHFIITELTMTQHLLLAQGPQTSFILFLKGTLDTHKLYDSLGSSWNVCNILWLTFLNGHLKYLFLPCQKPLRSQQAILVHVSLNDNELLLAPPLSSMGNSTQDTWIAAMDSIYGLEVVLIK